MYLEVQGIAKIVTNLSWQDFAVFQKWGKDTNKTNHDIEKMWKFLTMIHLFFFLRTANLRLLYDGASVKAEKKYLNFFSPPFFQKTAEKKYLNLFSPTFFPKQQKK